MLAIISLPSLIGVASRGTSSGAQVQRSGYRYNQQHDSHSHQLFIHVLVLLALLGRWEEGKDICGGGPRVRLSYEGHRRAAGNRCMKGPCGEISIWVVSQFEM